MNTLGRFNAAFVEACRVARLRRWPERLGQDALRLERGDFYGWRDTVPPAPGTVRVTLIGEPRPVVIAHDRVWWVPQLDQLLERLEGAISRRTSGSPAHVRELIARMLAERLRATDRSWEEVALELMIEQETAGR
ncbi:MAG: hypothetical protein E6J41_08265 [Chloroflexi bacterium]|nr:MAG: hypothetical protein E6J41_08265 [Chloroflexota bacterium]